MAKTYGIFVFHWDSTSKMFGSLEKTKKLELDRHCAALEKKAAGEQFDRGDILMPWFNDISEDKVKLQKEASKRQRQDNESRARGYCTYFKYRQRHLVHEVEPIEFIDSDGLTHTRWAWKMTKADLKLLEK